jgi:hypothetical protein
MKSLTEDAVQSAQREWGDAIVRLGQIHKHDGPIREEAIASIEQLYAIQDGGILFKPTLAAKIPFRTTLEGALSYFIGGNPDFPEDGGFVRQPWIAVRFDNQATTLLPNTAMAMGQYFFMDEDNIETKVEYSFVYVADPSGRLRIKLHHSSIPYSP